MFQIIIVAGVNRVSIDTLNASHFKIKIHVVISLKAKNIHFSAVSYALI